MRTSDLISSLTNNVTPVKRLRSPWVRASRWLLLASVVLGLLTVMQGVRPNFMEKMQQPSFFIGMLASLLTGVFATIATFMVSLPDRSRRWLLLPLPTLLLWVANIGYQCLEGWVPVRHGDVSLGIATSCLATLVLTSLPLSLAMFAMLRYSAAFRPMPVILMASLAVSALTANALSMFHPMDATVMILGWNLGVALIFALLAMLFGRRAIQLE
ncbi:MAG: DUF1109 domain-containing protein [Edaphobacter sp.]|uniref:DUF1109 domain-containing protein n=1 Tax=Edaphobacter sp. TaxID=1934404 RepID=UPI002397606B|nr:DUF1109 domain-containing protein [Edaphobacter sp.]MDE1175605.1 DUF1109 domain-containing protein [Edaphobacter sp.]